MLIRMRRSESSPQMNRNWAGVFRTARRSGVLFSKPGRIILLVLLLFSMLNMAGPDQSTSASQSDITNAVVLYDSHNPRMSDSDFRKISEYYGLKSSDVDISAAQLQDSNFRNEQGSPLEAAYIDADTLTRLNANSLSVLKTAVITDGVKLLVTELVQDSSQVYSLTNGEVTGAQTSVITPTKYFITSTVPEVSRQFTGQTVSTQSSTSDYALSITPGASNTAAIITGGSYITNTYPMFARYKAGIGEIFMQSTRLYFDLDQTRLADSYYAYRDQDAPNETFQDFSKVVPMMMFLRYAGGDKAWHSDRQFASLMVDDPPLTQPFSGAYTNSFYSDLLTNMKAHKFATTMSYVPYNYQTTQPDVVSLFVNNPNYYSLVIHGDRHTCPEMPASLGSTQLKAIALDALSRMAQLQISTTIPFGKDMVFPCGQFDLESLTALKQTGFDSTVNAGTIPGNATKPTNFDYGMYQADLDFSNFASINRVDVEYSTPLHELFVGRPLLIFTHPAFFQNGMTAFNSWADSFNAITGGPEWQSTDYIIKHLYLEKLNGDQSVSAMFYTRDVFVKNVYSTAKTFHFTKKETLDTPIVAVMVNGVSTSYSVNNGQLQFDASIPAGQEVEVNLYYANDATSLPVPRLFIPYVGNKDSGS